MWLYCTGTDSPENNHTDTPNIVLYDFHESRASQCAIDFLQGYSGYLQVDGYQAYASTDAILSGCWDMLAVNSKKRISYKVKVNPR
jgi:transposase